MKVIITRPRRVGCKVKSPCGVENEISSMTCFYFLLECLISKYNTSTYALHCMYTIWSHLTPHGEAYIVTIDLFNSLFSPFIKLKATGTTTIHYFNRRASTVGLALLASSRSPQPLPGRRSTLSVCPRNFFRGTCRHSKFFSPIALLFDNVWAGTCHLSIAILWAKLVTLVLLWMIFDSISQRKSSIL